MTVPNAPHPHPRLPPELIDRIVDFLHDDWPALVACARASSSASSSVGVGPGPCARFHLAQISIPLANSANAYAELRKFSRMFNPESDLARLPRALSIEGVIDTSHDSASSAEHPYMSAPTFPSALDFGHLHNLRALSLCNVAIDLGQRFLCFLCLLPALEQLSLSGLSRPRRALTGRTFIIPDKPPSSDAKAALRARLKVLRIVESRRASANVALMWSYDPLLGLFAAAANDSVDDGDGDVALEEAQMHFSDMWRAEPWTVEVCAAAARTLTALEVTFAHATDEDAPRYDPAYLANRLDDLTACAALRSLALRYDPEPISTSDAGVLPTTHGQTRRLRMNDRFVRLLATTISAPMSTPGAGSPDGEKPPFPALESFRLTLCTPEEAVHSESQQQMRSLKLDLEPFEELACALRPVAYPRLARVSVVLETHAVTKPHAGMLDTVDAMEVLSLGEDKGERGVWGAYLEMVRGALSTLVGGVEVSVEVRHV